MSWHISILVFRNPDQPFNSIIKTILNSKMDKNCYEVIFVGSINGAKDNNRFTHAVVNKERPLVRAFYDNFSSNPAVRMNSLVKEAHCPMIMLWPGIYFSKLNFKPLPEDVVDVPYYLMMWLKFNPELAEEFEPFGEVKYKANLKDTLRFLYLFGEVSGKLKMWYLGWLLRAIGRSLMRRK